MTGRDLIQPALIEEDVAREIVEHSEDILQVIAQGAELGRKQGRADMLSTVIHHVNGKLNDDYGARGGMTQEWQNGYKTALHNIGVWLAVLAAEETR